MTRHFESGHGGDGTPAHDPERVPPTETPPAESSATEGLAYREPKPPSRWSVRLTVLAIVLLAALVAGFFAGYLAGLFL
ncbi:hypothetical protein C1701_20780 [Actinoalloteichus sp. AHMU CJ021]|uniref:Uncharacterized protein n=1 Tax=Actinoalloteichus caeruleus DSM 43889 TaxID=1120930 RepID=A0ABT1JQ38_ACTCY|nr:DUF6480 family protein [Actinoalloteichus caeruleus]AUS80371.1 hypothetical protein C1701_20780 [Actinoalloteichus sp. AHMU CJ021]MCP2334632.1 hypothetical protein [Actinoalloteichus caeruleus DSM 43889]